MKFNYLMIFSILLFFASCNKDQLINESPNLKEAKVANYSTLSISDFEDSEVNIDPEKTYEHFQQISDLKSENNGLLSISDFEKLGDASQNLDLLYALLISEHFGSDQVFSKEESLNLDSDENTENVASLTLTKYRWDGVNRYYSFWWRTTYFLCDKLHTFNGNCNGTAVSKRWRRCGSVDCNIPYCWF